MKEVGLVTDEFLSTYDLAVKLKMSPRTLEDWRAKKIGPDYIQPSGRRGPVLYSWNTVCAWLQTQTVKADAAS
jgi:hypothetical protein